jgi:choline dehydrogenase-like flavoprotein
LSAGSVSTPQILMLSGIGPKDHLQVRRRQQRPLPIAHINLQALGIPLLVDSPVGRNLQDHVMVPITIKSKTFAPLQSEGVFVQCVARLPRNSAPAADGTLANFIRYLRTRDGPFSSVGLEGTAFYRTGA